jgi:hypothetical protein
MPGAPPPHGAPGRLPSAPARLPDDPPHSPGASGSPRRRPIVPARRTELPSRHLISIPTTLGIPDSTPEADRQWTSSPLPPAHDALPGAHRFPARLIARLPGVHSAPPGTPCALSGAHSSPAPAHVSLPGTHWPPAGLIGRLAVALGRLPGAWMRNAPSKRRHARRSRPPAPSWMRSALCRTGDAACRRRNHPRKNVHHRLRMLPQPLRESNAPRIPVKHALAPSACILVLGTRASASGILAVVLRTRALPPERARTSLQCARASRERAPSSTDRAQ